MDEKTKLTSSVNSTRHYHSESDPPSSDPKLESGESSATTTATIPSQTHKLTVWTGMVFIAGEMAGTGALALPKAVENAGWIGLVMILMTCVASGWCGILLGKCWLILEERYSKYREQCRDPYPSIGYECFGKPASVAVSVCIDITMFGASVVFIILAGQNFHEIFYEVPALRFSSCFWMMIIAAVVTPFVWLGTPKDFWPAAVGATVATALASIVLIAAISTNPVAQKLEIKHNDITIESFALAFGTILFGCGGAPAYPTIQHDMKNTADFPKAIVLAYIILFLIYFPMSAVAYLLLGNTLTDNVLQGLGHLGKKTWMYYTTQVLICTHLLSALVIIINPVCQELEKLAKIPLHFSWKRALLRTCVMAAALFVGECVPSFGPILSLLGGSTLALLCVIFPCVFYLKLCSLSNPSWPIRKASLAEWIFSIEMVILGTVGGVATIYSSIKALTNQETFLPPCFLNTTIDVVANP